VAAGDAVRSVAVGDRVLGCFQVACGTCALCRAGNFHRCERSRTFGHGAARAFEPARGGSPEHELRRGKYVGQGNRDRPGDRQAG
jgi:threonine dehydrogenase-like Zn-dependent dehydrogenase